MIYITGDTHGDFTKIDFFCKKMNTTKQDIIIILGDAGINYYLNEKDEKIKRHISNLPITLFCLHGNHEARPETISSYELSTFFGGQVYIEKSCPNIIFAKDAEIYDIEGKKTLVIGGAYSIDKDYRLTMGYKWFPDEQPTKELKNKCMDIVNSKKIDIILSHTGPKKFEPVECFLSFVDQTAVDKTTEEFLDKLEAVKNYNQWYFGHYHTDKKLLADNKEINILFNDIKEF